MIVYVAGAYSAPDSWTREENIRRAERLSLQLFLLGHAAICVHTMTRYFHAAIDEDVMIQHGLTLLERCDAVVLVEGWRESAGTLGEIEHARAHAIPVFEDLAAFRLREPWA